MAGRKIYEYSVTCVLLTKKCSCFQTDLTSQILVFLKVVVLSSGRLIYVW